jgi:hypothetical protein
MIPESEKYNKVLELLRNSKPVIKSTADIKEAVIKKISETSKQKPNLSDFIDFIFGWVYISWVRRSLITAYVFLVGVFIWQQSIIIKHVNLLSRSTIVIDGETLNSNEDKIEKVLMMYRAFGRNFPPKTITITDKQLKELLDSANEIQNKYKDIENLFESDPELRRYIEQKLLEKKYSKIKL